jgi:hypothetical protein
MKTQGINLEPLIKSGATDADCVDALICAADFERLIASANNGDHAAAKDLLGWASTYLMSNTFGPMPPELRRYLGWALAAVSLDEGPSADVALNLKKPGGGRPRRAHSTKLRIGHLIYEQMASGKTLEGSCVWLADHIHAGLKQYEDFYGFKEIPDHKTLEGIYNEVRPELARLYQQVERKRES